MRRIVLLGLVILAAVVIQPKAHAQIYHTVTIRSCSLDQVFLSIGLTDKLGQTLITGEISGRISGSPPSVYVTGTSSINQRITVQGQTRQGYAGIDFVAELPILMSILTDIVVCVR